mgnify:FL=1
MNDKVNLWKKVKGDALGKYTQRILPEGIKLDLFFADENNLGCIMLIRTGNWRYSKWMMGTVCRRNGYIMQGGYLWYEGDLVSVPTEERFYELLKLPFVQPNLRNL